MPTVVCPGKPPKSFPYTDEGRRAAEAAAKACEGKVTRRDTPKRLLTKAEPKPRAKRETGDTKPR